MRRSTAGVLLSTVHRVKGQEWPHVVVHHATAGLLPHHLVVDAEEERRVLHVGITRGRRSVTVVAGNPPSPFLAELAEPGEPPPLRATPPPAAASGCGCGCHCERHDDASETESSSRCCGVCWVR